jgi:hypothetical protein
MTNHGSRLHKLRHEDDGGTRDCDCTNQQVYGREGWKFTDDTISTLNEGETGSWTQSDIEQVAEEATDRAWLLRFNDVDGFWRCVEEADDALIEEKRNTA